MTEDMREPVSAQEKQLTQAAAKASEPVFKPIWDNSDDAEYDHL